MRIALVSAVCAVVALGGYASLHVLAQDRTVADAQVRKAEFDVSQTRPLPMQPPADFMPQEMPESMPAPRQAAPMSRGLDFTQQQQIGTVCETPYGICTVAPAPILSVCYCGSDVGTITR